MQDRVAKLKSLWNSRSNAMQEHVAKLKDLWNSRSGADRTTVIVAGFFLLVAFLPTLQFDYAPQDQWRAFRYEAYGPHEVVSPFFVRTGRPLAVFGEYLEHHYVRKIADFRTLRPICLAIYACSGLALALGLFRACGSLPLAVAASLLFLYVPGVSFMYYQGLTGAPVSLCLGLGGISYFLLMESPGPSASRICRFGRRDHCGCLVFMAALMIYPAWALIVLPLALLGFALRQHESTWDRLLQMARVAVIYLAAALAYYAFIKFLIFINFARAGSLGDMGNYEFAMESSAPRLWHKFLMVVEKYSNIAAFPVLNLGNGAGALAVVFFGVLVGARFALERRCARRLATVAWAALGSCLVFLAFFVFLAGFVAPWLVSGSPGFSARYIVTLNFFLSVVVLTALWKIGACVHERASLALVLLLCAWATAAQNKLATCEVVTSGLEIAEMRKGVNQWLELGGAEKCRNIVVVRPSATRPQLVLDLPYRDEPLGDNCLLATTCNPEHIRQMFRALLYEKYGPRPNPLPPFVDCRFDRKMARESLAEGKLVLQQTNTGEYVDSENTLIINLSRLGTHFIAPHKLQLAPVEPATNSSSVSPTRKRGIGLD